MKRYTRIITAALAALFTLATASTYAQLPTSGNWGTYTVAADETVNLTGDVTITGTITIKSGKTLTINSNGAERVINVFSGTARNCFANSGVLSLVGTDDARIIVDGGANFIVNADADGMLRSKDALSLPADMVTKPANKNIINCSGTSGNKLNLYYVTFQDIYVPETYGVIWQTKACFTTVDHCLFQRIKSMAGSSLFARDNTGGMKISDSEFKHQVNTANYGEGVIMIDAVDEATTLALSNCHFHHNFTNEQGCCLEVMSYNAKFTVESCEFDYNFAGVLGGAISSCSSIEFVGDLTKIHHNEAKEGAGMFLSAFNSDDISSPVDMDVTFKGNVEIYENLASNRGGGLHVQAYWTEMADGSSFDVVLDGVNIHDNVALGAGGGVYISDMGHHEGIFTVTTQIKGGSIYNNTGKNGGGLYVEESLLNITGGTIYGNKATENGGGLYSSGKKAVTLAGGVIKGNTSDGAGGGAYLACPISLSDTEISKNEAATNGGGVYATDAVTITGGTITENGAANGAGLYTAGTKTVTLSGGSITENTATAVGGGAYLASPVAMSGIKLEDNESTTNGGGAYVTGNVDFTAGTVVGNKAADGAGIYVADGGVMNYNNGGKLTGNEASQRGGGVYLASGADASHVSTLNISFTPSAGDEFSLFNNTAALVTGGAGDDIYAEAGNTKMTVPDISTMTLEGYSHANAKLAWYEDYEDSDANYASGTNANTESGYSPKRYRPNRDAYDEVYSVADIATNTSYYGKYLALTMGFEYRGINIRRKGLEPGENAIYKIVVTDDGGNVIRTQYVVVKGTEAEWDGTHLQIDGIPAGYKVNVDETTWTWYKTSTDPADITKTETIDSGKGLVVFSFENTHAEDTPLHDEDIEDNTLK